MKILIIILSVAVSLNLFAQNPDSGNVVVHSDYKIEALLGKHTEINMAKETEPGWRVQIMATGDKARVYKLKSEFYLRFKEYPSYVDYWQPNFRLRIGDFKTRLEAYKCLVTIQPHYPDAQLVPDDINLKPEE